MYAYCCIYKLEAIFLDIHSEHSAKPEYLHLALYPGSRGGEREPGISCVHMRLISPDSEENRIFSIYSPCI